MIQTVGDGRKQKHTSLKIIALLCLLVLQTSPGVAQTIDCERVTDPAYLQNLLQDMDTNLDSMYKIEQFQRAADECFKRRQEKLQREAASTRQAERRFSGSKCIQHRVEEGRNGPTIFVRNACKSTKDVNICLTFRDAKFGGERNSHRLDPGDEWNFGFFNIGDDGRYKFGLRWCNPNKTTASHTVCQAQCPQPGW